MKLSLAWIPCSKKNNMALRRRRGGVSYPAPNERVVQEERRINRTAKAVIVNGCKTLKDFDRALSEAVLPKDHDVALTVSLIIGKKKGLDGCRIQVEDLGIPPQRSRTGRIRDAINVPAIIADALQGVCYVDDVQITRLVVEVLHE